MNFVFISPNFPEAYRWFCIRLRENGVNVPNVKDCWLLADALNISLDELVGRNK